MARCTRTWTLEVHPRDPNGDRSLDNAILLCLPCYESTPAFGTPNGQASHPGFSRKTVLRAIARAGGRCECVKSCDGCNS